jgi:CelD/BcsL family acetyltransferase involved in cellulose biosynthesis
MNTTSRLRAHVVLGGEAFATLDDAWDRLAAANPSATVFQTAPWYRAWLSAAAAAEGATPLVVAVAGGSGTRAAVALQRERGSAVLRPLSAPWADYHDAVGDPNDDASLRALADGLTGLVREGFSLALDDVVADGLLARACVELGEALPSTPVAAVDLTDGEHVTRVVARKEYVVKWRRLHRLGPVRCVHHTEQPAIRARFPAFVALHRAQWQGRVDAVAPFDGGVVDAAFSAMVEQLTPRHALMLTELLLGDRAIAMYLGFVHAGRYLAYRTAYDAAYRRLSPGHLMLARMILDFRAAGLRELDLMRGAYGYKDEYANRAGRNVRWHVRAATP